MSAPVIPSLGASTVNRKWVLEVNTGTYSSPTWVPVGGVNNFQPVTDDANFEDDSRFSGGGYSSQTKTSAAWSATCTVSRAPQSSDSTSYDVGQEFLRSHAEGVFGPANTVDVRFYEFDPSGLSPARQAYRGYAAVGWAEQGGAYNALSSVQITLTNTADGKLTPITHPYPLTASVPVIDSVTPRAVGTAGGAAISITGRHFTGTTGVTVGATACTNFTVVSDSLIIATVPAKTAGSQALVVTNATGASTTGGNLTYS